MRKTMRWCHHGLVAGVCLLMGAATGGAQEAEQPEAAEAQAAETQEQDVIGLGTLNVIGSRLPGRSAQDSPVPVDVIQGSDLQTYGIRDMDSLLRASVPSYNVNEQPISDAATLIRPANLRGLPPDHTLVLVNGKRRHRGSVISILGGGLANGSQGVDLSAIPAIALQQVEVLRDGAAAQYGSDAIAGVLNFKLRENREGLEVQTTLGQQYHGDGDKIQVAANLGLPLTENGFANFSFEFMNVDETSRSVQRGDARGFIEAGNMDVRRPAAQIWGSPEIQYDYKFFGNLGIDLEDINARLYAFGNYAERKVEGGFFYRNPNTRSGVFNGPLVDANDRVLRDNDGSPILSFGEEYPDDYRVESFRGREKWELSGIDRANLSDTIRVADLSRTGEGCPVLRTNTSANYPAGLAGLPDHCFAFNERFPGGFTPRFGGYVKDWSIAFGLRGELENLEGAYALFNGWSYDASAYFGQNSVDLFMHNTINPQLAAMRTNIPTSYRPGSDTQFEQTFNFDISRPVELGIFHSPLNAAFGFEYRIEEFEKEIGGQNSWYIDDRPGGLSAQGFGVGSNGFGGYRPDVAGEWKRHNYALYMDLEAEVIRSVTLGVAGRYENFDGDIGETVNGKVSLRWQIIEALALRGAVSSGFRAPTPGQINLRNTTTAFGADGLVDEGTLPAAHPAAAFFRAKPLTPEKSVNYSAGTVFNLGGLELTLDYYRIKVQDRIGLSERFKVSDLTPTQLAQFNMLVPEASSLSSVRYYTNDFDTTTQGLDLVATYPLTTAAGDTRFTFVGNWNDTEVDSRNPEIISNRNVIQLEEKLPEFRFTLTADHSYGPWRLLTRLHFLDDFRSYPADVESWGFRSGERWLMDIEASYTFLNVPFMQAVTLAAGAENVFDQYPRRVPYEGGGGSGVGMKYPEASPFGFNGGFYYLRAGFEF